MYFIVMSYEESMVASTDLLLGVLVLSLAG